MNAGNRKKVDDQDSGSDWDSVSEAVPAKVNPVTKDESGGPQTFGAIPTRRRSESRGSVDFPQTKSTGQVPLRTAGETAHGSPPQTSQALPSSDRGSLGRHSKEDPQWSSEEEGKTREEVDGAATVIEEGGTRLAHRRSGPTWSQLLSKKLRMHLLPPPLVETPKSASLGPPATSEGGTHEDIPAVTGSQQQLLPNAVHMPATKHTDTPWDTAPFTDDERPAYYFKHGNPHYYSVGENDYAVSLGTWPERSRAVGHRVWAEFFAIVQVPLDFVVAFFLEMLTFVALLLQRVLAGTTARFGDILIKPLLTAFFNGLFHPACVLVWNVAVAVRNVLLPPLDLLSRLAEAVAVPLRAIRLVEIHWPASKDGRFQRPTETV